MGPCAGAMAVGAHAGVGHGGSGLVYHVDGGAFLHSVFQVLLPRPIFV